MEIDKVEDIKDLYMGIFNFSGELTTIYRWGTSEDQVMNFFVGELSIIRGENKRAIWNHIQKGDCYNVKIVRKGGDRYKL